MTDENERLGECLLREMATSPVSVTVSYLAHAIGRSRCDVQRALHRLDDADRVIMRNGWYCLSAAERKRRE